MQTTPKTFCRPERKVGNLIACFFIQLWLCGRIIYIIIIEENKYIQYFITCLINYSKKEESSLKRVVDVFISFADKTGSDSGCALMD